MSPPSEPRSPDPGDPGPPRLSAEIQLRPATPRDRAGIARVHVETWKTTYRGLVPDARLDQMTVERDLQGGFGRWLSDPPPGFGTFVGEAVDGGSVGIVGFAVAHPNRRSDPIYTGELGAIYVLKAWQRQGLGRRLVGSAASHLLAGGHTAMLLWVLEGNPHRRFYERLGGEVVRREVRPVAGTTLPELAFGWRDLRGLTVRLGEMARAGASR